MELNAITVEVAKLALQPGEVLVVKVPPGKLEMAETWAMMDEHLHRTFPDNKVLLCTSDIEFTVVEPPPAS